MEPKTPRTGPGTVCVKVLHHYVKIIANCGRVLVEHRERVAAAEEQTSCLIFAPTGCKNCCGTKLEECEKELRLIIHWTVLLKIFVIVQSDLEVSRTPPPPSVVNNVGLTFEVKRIFCEQRKSGFTSFNPSVKPTTESQNENKGRGSRADTVSFIS